MMQLLIEIETNLFLKQKMLQHVQSKNLIILELETRKARN